MSSLRLNPWFGEVPAKWQRAQLKRFYSVRLGKMLQPNQSGSRDELVPYMRAANIMWEGPDISDIKEMWASPAEIRDNQLEKGDLLVSEGGDVGRSCLWDAVIPRCIFQNAINRVRPRSQNSTKFLFYVMKAVKGSGWIDILCNKATIAHFTAEKVNALEVPLPTPAEQQRIAAYLDAATGKIDRLMSLRRRQMELLREQRAALIQQAVTRGLNPRAPLKDSGLPWLGQIPKRWKLAVLKWQFQIASGDAVPTESLLQEPEGAANVPAIGGNGVMGYTTKSNVSSPRLAVGRVGALCGNVHLVNPPAWITDNALQVYGVRGYELEFLWQLLKVMDLNRLANQNAQPLITGTLVKNQRAPLPPQDEQREILAHIQRETAKLDGLHRSYERQLALLAEYRASLIHECVTGQRPVPN